MTIWFAILLGLVQGVTEFIPVSSSGHLIFMRRFIDVPDEHDFLLFDIILHVATLFAIMVVFRKKIWDLIRKPLNMTNLWLVVATSITVGMVLIFDFAGLIEFFRDYRILPFTFMITAIVLLVPSLLPKRDGGVTWKTGVYTGVAQGVAVIPGISRSGATITAALASGTKREQAAEFVFIMAIPIIIASLVYELWRSPGSIGAVPVESYIFGFVASFVAGIFAIKIMLKLIKNVKLYWFSVYLFILSVTSFMLFYVV